MYTNNQLFSLGRSPNIVPSVGRFAHCHAPHIIKNPTCLEPSNMAKEPLFQHYHGSSIHQEQVSKPNSRSSVGGFFTLRQEVKKVNHKDQLCLVVRHDDYKNADDFIELHAVVKHWKVEVEGDSDLCFTARVNPQVEQEGEPTPLPQAVDELLNNQATTEETLEALRGVVDIDDDNDPAPENIPAPTDISSSSIFGEWGHEGVCFRKQQGNQNIRAKLNVALDPNADDPIYSCLRYCSRRSGSWKQ